MAVDKLVDSTQLDADLTSVANAIRTKGGTSANLAFPAGFVSAVQAIPSGGGVDWDAIASGDEPSGLITLQVTAIAKSAFRAFQPSHSWSIYAPNALTIGDSAFRDNTNLSFVRFPRATSAPNGYVCYGTKNMTTVDVGKISSIANQFFNMASAFHTLIMRKSDGLTTLGNVNCFSSTYFASGKSGGTIYIPKALYDHLGDGSALDYKAATNWSTVNGYGTITWAKLEGSQYEDPDATW